MNSDLAPELDPAKLYPFSLDDFQLAAIAALNAGKSVVVCAPTGSGKTLIGEYAIHRALKRGKRVFYTTPLKALSNQKLRDFREQFGHDQVGLLTGDLTVNRDAPVLVMTTEIFRNMLYGTPIGQVGTSLANLEAVVLDECHYMNDRQRGTVWEESIIYCPSQVQLVALSATVANSDQLTDWLCQVHGPTELIYSDFRPVPLEFYFANSKGLFPLLTEDHKAMNPRLKPKKTKGRSDRQHRGRSEDIPTLPFVLSQLQQRDMLPAIYFIFSRKGCDQSVAEVGDLSLVQGEEATRLRQQVDDFRQRYPEAARFGQVEALYRGVAAHHAGILPAWKGLVEELFQQGLIKVVFATETLAAGINMPARTTVISTLSKRTDTGHRLLHASEFLQMAGRAGRRGMDKLGHVVTLQTAFEGAKEAAYLATSKADPLVSQFTPSYGMVLNLLQTHTLPEAKELVERSFGQYLATLHLQPQRQAIANLEALVNQSRQALANVDTKLLTNYEKLQERLKEEKRLLKTLQQQAGELHASDIARALPFALAGTVLSLKGKHMPVSEPLPAVLVTKVSGSGQFPYLVCLGQDNRWYVVTVSDVVGLHGEFPRLAEVDHLNPPLELEFKPGHRHSGDDQTHTIACRIPTPPPLANTAPEVYAQLQRVAACEEQLKTHPARQWGDVAALLKRQRRLQDLEDELADRRAKLASASHRHWQEFIALTEILQVFDCLEWIQSETIAPTDSPAANGISPDADGLPDNALLKPTELGQTIAAIRGENELWLGLAITSHHLDDLEPQQLAAVCAALVTESVRPDSWTDYNPSPAVEDVLENLWSWQPRRQLIKLQRQYQVSLPVWLETRLVGIVEQWALGAEWSELCVNTNLDEGDVVRMLRRTLDLLSQIPYVPYLSDTLRDNADRAACLLNRFPVNELIE
ncbi:MAG: DEAD/DEAH box helicase [Cyanobacteria bacterium]|nr:DEAD/DEAH box helicase [Cyanobacteriota bacterium]MDW8200720.1 DEAD/DEAH box helicase [Cyanobacteriota bacterium SKYGB_h_bin112]